MPPKHKTVPLEVQTAKRHTPCGQSASCQNCAGCAAKAYGEDRLSQHQKRDESRLLRAPSLLAMAASMFALVISFLPATQAHAAGMLVAKGQFGGRLEIKSQDVNVTINNGVAVTTIEQVFLNKEDRIVEALYTFPVPKGASVANFSMWINGKEMIGEVLEKKRAREIYESYKATRVDPGLLEQVDYKRFEMRIYPIGANKEQRVRLTYYQPLDIDHDWLTYVYPLSTLPDRSYDQKTTGRFSLTFDLMSKVPIHAVKSPSHDQDFAHVNFSRHYVQSSLEVSKGDISRDVVIRAQMKRPHTGFDLVTSRDPDISEDGYFQLSLTAGDELNEVQKGMDFVFLLDVSGSMAADGKLAMSVETLPAFFDSLSPEDRFEIITFNNAPKTLFRELQVNTPEIHKEAERFLKSRRSKGGTQLRPALELAYRYHHPDRPLNVVILSDGMTEQRGQLALLRMLKNRPSGTTIFAIGVGNEVNRPVLKQVAQRTGGLAEFISRGDDIKQQAKSFRRKLVRPAISNLKIHFGDNIHSVEPATLPNLYHGAPLRIYGRYKSAQSTKFAPVRVSGFIQGQKFEKTIPMKLPEKNLSNPQIDRMWAWHAIESLQAKLRDGSGNERQIKERIVALCEGYSITSEYASFIVLENDAEFKRWQIERRNALRIMKDRKAIDRARAQMNQLRDLAIAKQSPNPALMSASPNLQPAQDMTIQVDNEVLSRQQPKRQAQPVSKPASKPASRPASQRAPKPRRKSNNGDIFRRPGGGGGGGAFGPVEAMLLLSGLLLIVPACRRRAGKAA